MDKDKKRNKVIEKDKKSGEWHSHIGYLHRENSETAHDKLSASDKKMLEKVRKLWQNNKR